MFWDAKSASQLGIVRRTFDFCGYVSPYVFQRLLLDILCELASTIESICVSRSADKASMTIAILGQSGRCHVGADLKIPVSSEPAHDRFLTSSLTWTVVPLRFPYRRHTK